MHWLGIKHYILNNNNNDNNDNNNFAHGGKKTRFFVSPCNPEMECFSVECRKKRETVKKWERQWRKKKREYILSRIPGLKKHFFNPGNFFRHGKKERVYFFTDNSEEKRLFQPGYFFSARKKRDFEGARAEKRLFQPGLSMYKICS